MRFKQTPEPLVALNYYLSEIYAEALRRGYTFDVTKFTLPERVPAKICVTSGQLHYEFLHLMRKLRRRSPGIYAKHKDLNVLEPHVAFRIVEGGVEKWEIFD